MKFTSNINTCRNCPKRQKPCSGACLCTLNSRDILENARNDSCPLHRFSFGLGDLVEILLDVITFGWAKRLAKRYEKTTGKPCGCEQRKEALNRMVPNLK
jgi:hypothetical protein